MARKKGPQVMEAFEYIKEKILTYEFEPGEPLSYSQLAQKLKMSRSPIKEAIFLALNENLVAMDAEQRPYVAELTFYDILELFQVREAIEVEAIKIIGINGGLTEKQFGEMREILDRMMVQNREAITINGGRRYEYDDLFHKTIAEYSGNQRLVSMLASVRLQNIRIRYLNIIRPTRWMEAEKEHEAIFRSLCENDYEQAALHVSSHIHAMIDEYRRILNNPVFCTAINSITALIEDNQH